MTTATAQMKRLAVSPSESEVELQTPPKRRKLFLPLLFRRLASSPSSPSLPSPLPLHHRDVDRPRPPWELIDRKSMSIPSSYPYEEAIPLPKPNRKSMVETPSRSMTMTSEPERTERPRRPRARSSFDRTFSSPSTPTERNFSVPYI